MKVNLSVVGLLLCIHLSAQSKIENSVSSSEVEINTGELILSGTLIVPAVSKQSIPVALIIAGSGATDRDGNNIKAGLHTNAYKILADSLAAAGIASLRFDKRSVGKSLYTTSPDKKRLFDDEVQDALHCLKYLRNDKRFDKFIVIGHSQGALIGLLIAKDADKYISLSGIGKRGSETLKEQLKAQPPLVAEKAFPIIDSLSAGYPVKDVPPFLNALFGPSMQPYVISWFRYDPATELAKLKIPILVVQGTNDIQIPVEDAKRLAAASSNSQLLLIDNMNHNFRIITGSKTENQQSYSNPALPVSSELLQQVIIFIRSN